MNKDLQDHVWSILPKEFKEEVKYEYNRVATKARKDEYDLGFMHAHEGIFGIHILTSDADEEEEMLYVSRKQVQKMYSYNEEELTKDPTNKGALLLKLRLDALFGSKCRPDEGTDCTPVEVGVAENTTTSNVGSLEPKPAEPKFHVGQRVRCLNDGETYIVLAKVGKHHYSLQGVEHDVHEDYLEPYTEPTDLNKSSETCTDNCSSQNHFVVKDEMVDNIIKDGFKNHNRLNIAAMAMQGILSNIDLFKNVLETGMETLGGDGISFRAVAKSSFLFADALINEAEEGGSK